MLPSYFDYVFVHLRQKVGLRPEFMKPKIFVNFRPEPGPTYNTLSQWGAIVPHRPVDQNAEKGKCHVFSTSTTVFCNG